MSVAAGQHPEARAELEARAAKTNQRGEFNSGTGRPLRQCGQQCATLALPLLVLFLRFILCIRLWVRKQQGAWRVQQVADTPRFLLPLISPFTQLPTSLLASSFKHVMDLRTSGHVTFSEGFILSLKKKNPKDETFQMNYRCISTSRESYMSS